MAQAKKARKRATRKKASRTTVRSKDLAEAEVASPGEKTKATKKKARKKAPEKTPKKGQEKTRTTSRKGTPKKAPSKGGRRVASGAAAAPAKKSPRTRKKAAAKGAKKASRTRATNRSTPGTDEVILLPVRGMLLFPGVVLPVMIGRERSIRAIQAAVAEESPIGILLQKDPTQEDPGPEDLYTIGTLAEVLRYLQAPDGGHHAVARGAHRFRVLEFLQTEPYVRARIEKIEESQAPEETTELEARFLHLRQLAERGLELLPQDTNELAHNLASIEAPGLFCDVLATFFDLEVEEKQSILEVFDVEARMVALAEKLQHKNEVLQLTHNINEQTQGSLEKAQREYFLREQLRTIREELGEGGSQEVEDLRAQIEAAGMPEDVHREVMKELLRLERTPEASMEHGTIRTYLDWMIELPWSKESEDNLDLARARAILDEDHFGLKKIKKRILEFLAVRKLAPRGKGPILCLVGPPGVGKTSLGQSIARALDRRFVRASLGGVHDEAEIRGHRRTYVGALPGKVIQELRKAGTCNPVFMLDEMDKLGRGFHGDPSSALLEVLDPAQNDTFEDHYLGVPFDLSRVLFVATANVLSEIPGPLRDRCEVIELSGYTEEEKLQIAKRYLVKRRLEENGLDPEHFGFEDEALSALIRSYTREAGVRNLEREIGSVVRHHALRIAELPEGEVAPPHRVTVEELQGILGPETFDNELAQRTSLPGVATGLSWTPVGGQILFVEATGMPGKGNLLRTGQLGDVMKESAQAAHTLVRARAEELGIERDLSTLDVHLHVPAGAIPKDGPSAGVTLFTALVSMLTGRRVRREVAMTGEVSLRGLVLPVGGIKEKVLAAHRAGIRTVLLPARNMKDLEDVPSSVRAELEFVPLDRVESALDHALEARESIGQD